jgi:PAS domain S-box-containing protein
VSGKTLSARLLLALRGWLLGRPYAELAAKLRASEERLHLALVTARLGVRELDMITGQAYSSPEGVDIFGRDDHRDETFDRWFACVHPDDQAYVRANWDRALANPGTDLEQEYRFRKPDGTWHWIATHGKLMFEGGRAVRSFGVIQDITERKQIEIALRESETRLQLSQAAGRIGSWDWDIAGDRLYWSDLQCRQFGVDTAARDQVTYETWRRVVHPDDLPAVARKLRAALKDHAEFEIEYRIFSPSGVRWLIGRAHIFADSSGRAARMIGIDMDITDRRVLEDELRELTKTLETRVQQEVAARQAAQARAAHGERLQALGQLAGGVAHDFNNVLQAVSGAMRLIERRATDADTVRRLAQLAGEAAARGSSITRRLLAFGRRGDLRPEPIDAATLLVDLQAILAHTLGAAIRIIVLPDTSLRPLLADKSQLETSLINLATNARDAMPDGGTLTLAAAGELAGPGHPAGIAAGHYIRLSIIDTGAGMDAATLARASEPFFTTKKDGAGTGLGLAMAKGFAEQSGGGMRIDSIPGEGTAVTLWLPQADLSPTPPDRIDTSPPALIPLATATRILLVDDDLAVREVLAMELQESGYDVVSAASGPEAIAFLDAGESMAALVTDLSLPGMDGLSVIRAVQERHRGLPAILLTGYAGDGAALAVGGAVSGGFSLLRKPVNGTQLADRLAALLEAANPPLGAQPTNGSVS